VIALRVLASLAGALIVGATLMSAVRSFVLPRGDATVLTRAVFLTTRTLFNARMRLSRTYEDRDRIMALFAPISLLIVPFVWLVFVGGGYTLVYWGFSRPSWWHALEDSGSSLFTLGNAPVHGKPAVILSFTEAGLGLALLALLISFLPSMYSAFQRRETNVTLLEVRAGNPPSVLNMMTRYQRIHGLEKLDELWGEWEEWFADIEESHTTFGAMAFFRSPRSDRSWITAAGAVLDAASFASSSLQQHTPTAETCVRAGYVALRGIADFFGITYNSDPAPDDPISVSREEFDELWDALAAIGVPLKPDREAAWQSFAGWRVNYDEPLVAIATLVMAPEAPWSSDRGRTFVRPKLQFRHRRLARPPHE
jgi:hypothetical protein